MGTNPLALGVSRLGRAARALLLVSSAGVLFSPSLFAQSDTGVIHGRVTDARGQAQRVLVRLLAAGDIPAGDRYTGNEGEYVFETLPNGEYWVVVEAEGYRPFRQPVNLDTRLNPTMQINVILERQLTGAGKPSPVVSGSASSHALDAKSLPVPVDPHALREYDKGKSQERAGNLDSAADHYRKALQVAPGYYPALNNLAALYERQGRHAQSEDLLTKAIALNPQDGEAYVNLGHSLYEEGRYSEAVMRLEEGLKRSPGSATGTFFLGSAQLKLGDISAAETNLKRACSLDPQGLPAAHLQLANVYLKTHDLQQAAAELQTYLQAKPDDPQAAAIRGLLASVKTPNP